MMAKKNILKQNNQITKYTFLLVKLQFDCVKAVKAFDFLLDLLLYVHGRWRSGAIVRASDFGPRGPWFEPRPVHISLWP